MIRNQRMGEGYILAFVNLQIMIELTTMPSSFVGIGLKLLQTLW